MENERIVISQYKSPSVLTLRREPLPVPIRGEIRIRVEAAGVSFGDVAQRSGLFFAGAPKMPYTPGYDVAGTVEGVGDEVADLAKHLKLVVAAAVSNRWQNLLRGEADLLFDECEPSSGNVLRRCRPAGFDAAFDPIGGSHVWKTRAFVATHGTLVPFGISGAVKPGGQRNLADVVRLGLLLGLQSYGGIRESNCMRWTSGSKPFGMRSTQISAN